MACAELLERSLVEIGALTTWRSSTLGILTMLLHHESGGLARKAEPFRPLIGIERCGGCDHTSYQTSKTHVLAIDLMNKAF